MLLIIDLDAIGFWGDAPHQTALECLQGGAYKRDDNLTGEVTPEGAIYL
jgi:hypothetical protein